MEKKNEEKITISLEEYKELLVTKGKYEELINNPRYIYNYIYDKSIIDTTPKVTWTYCKGE